MNNETKPIEKQMTDDTAWLWRKRDLAIYSEDELLRAAKERETVRMQNERAARENLLVNQEVEKKYYEDLMRSCTTGTPEERFARALIRMSRKGLFVETLFGTDEQKTQSIVTLLRLHNISIRDGKEKLTADDYERGLSLFVSDPFIRKGHAADMRKTMFPDTPSKEKIR